MNAPNATLPSEREAEPAEDAVCTFGNIGRFPTIGGNAMQLNRSMDSESMSGIPTAEHVRVASYSMAMVCVATIGYQKLLTHHEAGVTEGEFADSLMICSDRVVRMLVGFGLPCADVLGMIAPPK